MGQRDWQSAGGSPSRGASNAVTKASQPGVTCRSSAGGFAPPSYRAQSRRVTRSGKLVIGIEDALIGIDKQDAAAQCTQQGDQPCAFLARCHQMQLLLVPALLQCGQAMRDGRRHAIEAGRQQTDLIARLHRHLDVEFSSRHPAAGSRHGGQVARHGVADHSHHADRHRQRERGNEQTGGAKGIPRHAQRLHRQPQRQPSDRVALGLDRFGQVPDGAIAIEIDRAGINGWHGPRSIPARGCNRSAEVIEHNQIGNRMQVPDLVEHLLDSDEITLGQGRGQCLIEHRHDLP